MPVVNPGLCPEAGSSLLAPQTPGYHRAAEALPLGEPLHGRGRDGSGWGQPRVPPTECNAIAQAQARKPGGQASVAPYLESTNV